MLQLTTTIPKGEAGGLLLIGEVLAGEEYQSRENPGLERPAQHAQGNKPSVVLEGGVAGVAEAPADKAAAQELCDGQSVEEPHVRQREHEGSDPEIGISVRVFISRQVDLLGHAHDICILGVVSERLEKTIILPPTPEMSYVQQHLVKEVQCVTAT